MDYQFLNDVDKGLSAENKFLSSKYFYNEIGDRLFVEIMHLPEYYLTRAEYDIFLNRTDEMIRSFQVSTSDTFELIELGAGDGTKTKLLLKQLLDNGFDFEYKPIDISSNALNKLAADFENSFPNLKISPLAGEYFQAMNELKGQKKKKIVLFLGSNLGNMTDEQSTTFMHLMAENLNSGDILLLGLDQIKSSEIVIPAYSDRQGITKQFNLNLLTRINNELGGDFNVTAFEHVVEYTEKEGIVKTFLQSSIEQKVVISALKKSFTLEKGENIHTEISRKYNEEILNGILKNTGLSIINKLMDSNQYFTDYILVKN